MICPVIEPIRRPLLLLDALRVGRIGTTIGSLCLIWRGILLSVLVLLVRANLGRRRRRMLSYSALLAGLVEAIVCSILPLCYGAIPLRVVKAIILRLAATPLIMVSIVGSYSFRVKYLRSHFVLVFRAELCLVKLCVDVSDRT